MNNRKCKLCVGAKAQITCTFESFVVMASWCVRQQDVFEPDGAVGKGSKRPKHLKPFPVPDPSPSMSGTAASGTNVVHSAQVFIDKCTSDTDVLEVKGVFEKQSTKHNCRGFPQTAPVIPQCNTLCICSCSW